MARRRRHIFIECFMGLSEGEEHVSYEKFCKLYIVLKEERLLPWALPSPVKGCAPIEATLFMALAREAPDKGLVFHEFIKLTDVLQQKLEYENQLGSFNRPNAAQLEKIQGIRSFVKSQRFDYTICLLLICNATNIYFRQKALKGCGYVAGSSNTETCLEEVPSKCEDATLIPNILNLMFSCLFCVEFAMRCVARVFVFDIFGLGDMLIIIFCFISDIIALSYFKFWTCSYLAAPVIVLR